MSGAGTLTLITPPAAEVFAAGDEVALAKAHAKIQHDDEDDLVALYLAAARGDAEAFTGRQFINATWEWKRRTFPCADEELPRAPLSSVTSIKYLDTAGVEQTIASSVYVVSTPSGPHAEPGRLSLASAQSWPTQLIQADAVRIRFVAGYGAAGTSVPAEIRHAILLLFGEMYETRRESVLGVSVSPAAVTAERLLWPFRVVRW